MARYLTDLDVAVRKSGLKVVEVPGWKTRGRPGAFAPKGILCHHTAGAGDGYSDAYFMAVTGRADLSAPLAQLALGRDGTVYILAAGRANHAGRCKAIGGLHGYPGQAYGDGNEQMIGIEAMNRGTAAEDWTPTQYGAYVRLVAALKAHYGWSIVFGHKETSTSGKVDPDFDMNQFRRDVAAPTTPPEEDMPTPADLVNFRLQKRDGTANTDSVGGMLADAQIYGYRTQKQVAALDAKVTALTASVQAMAAKSADPAAIAAAIAPLLPQGGEAVTDAQLEAALRKVLGSVDGATA